MDILPCLQTSNLNSALNLTRRQGLPVMPQQRDAILDISISLRNALNHSSELSIHPEDLRTSTTLLTLIGEWVCTRPRYKILHCHPKSGFYDNSTIHIYSTHALYLLHLCKNNINCADICRICMTCLFPLFTGWERIMNYLRKGIM